jgi:hypothetical protein
MSGIGSELARRLAAALALVPFALHAQDPVCEPGGCAGDIQGVFLCGYRDVRVETGAYCVLNNCQKPQLNQLGVDQFPFTQLVVGGEKDQVTNELRVAIEIVAPWNNWANDRDRNANASPNGQLDVAWFRGGPGYPDSQPIPPIPWTSAPDTIVSLCEDGTHDKLLTGLTQLSTCQELHDAKGAGATYRYGLRAQVCGGPCIPGLFDPETQSCPSTHCGRWTDLEVDLALSADLINHACPKMEEPSCRAAAQLWVMESGDLELVFPDTGPGAIFRYRHGGVGWPGAPEEERDALGRRTRWWQHDSGLPPGWSHDYALTLVRGKEPRHVWLITETGTYRSFWDTNGDGRSELTLPSDDERHLEPGPAGTVHLVDVDGSRHIFELNDDDDPYSGGRWIGWQDANGNRKTATYTENQRIVALPDGRKEIFEYEIPPDADDPKILRSLTEVGVDGTTTRTWRY